MTTSHPAAQLLKALFASALDEDYLEIRPLPIRSDTRLFIPLQQLHLCGFDGAVPVDLDGKANVFFGVLPRSRQGGTAADVAVATCLWADLDKGLPTAWSATLPLPSIMVETSPGKAQVYWLLQEPTKDLELVEELVRRLSGILDGDFAAKDRARILRLPGFQNIKYPSRPVARLLELHEDRRYSLAQIEEALPPNSGAGPNKGSNGHGGKAPHGKNAGVSHGKFDPHAGGSDVPQVMLDEIKDALLMLGARWNHDDRLMMSCPFPHVGGTSCDCPQAFYWSPVSGRWWCFCSDHPERKADEECVSGAAWRLWGVLFPGRRSPEDETTASSPLTLRGEEARNSQSGPYDPPPGWTVDLFREAPKHKRTVALLRMVGQTKKAEAEENCGVSLKGKCPKPQHGVVREGRSSGKTAWCAGCNTETSAKYLNMIFPAAPYSILRLQSHVEIPPYEAADLEPGSWSMPPGDSAMIAALIANEYAAATTHFRRIQRRYPAECLSWHFAVAQEKDGLQVELQVLVRHSENFLRVLNELTGGTRKQALYVPDTVVRYDYSPG
ncbi:MAG: DNA-primase RepB domain-containing protein [Chloroflexota bacterium]